MKTNLADVLQERGITQSDAAKALGISKSYMSEVCNGHRQPGRDLLVRIADLLGASPNYMLGEFLQPGGVYDAKPIELSPHQIVGASAMNSLIDQPSGFELLRSLPSFLMDRGDILVTDDRAPIKERDLAVVSNASGSRVVRCLSRVLYDVDFREIEPDGNAVKRVCAVLRAT